MDIFLQSKSIMAGAGILSILLLEFFLPNQHAVRVSLLKTNKKWKRWGKNLSLWVCNVILSRLFVWPITIFAATQQLNWRPALYDPWLWLIFEVIILDFYIYWWHRFNHIIPFLWRFHSVHHLDSTLDITTSVRFHFGEVAISAVMRGLFIWVSGISLTSVLLFETLLLIAAAFHHSAIKIPKWLDNSLSKVIVTPGWHWPHHHAKQKDTDSNYGTIFTFWDRIFRSSNSKQYSNDMKIGVEGIEDQKLLTLLQWPISKQK